MKMKLKIYLLSAVCVTAVVSGAYAGAGASGTAETIRSSVTEYIGSLVKSAEKPVIRFDGNVLVEPQKEYFAVTLPEITLNYPDAGTLNAGMIVANITQKTGGEWRVTAAMPESMVWTAADGSVNGILSFGAQKITGIWNPMIGFFTSAEAAIKDVRYVDAVNKIDIRAASVDRSLTVMPKGQRSSSVDGKSLISDIKGSFSGSKKTFSVASLSFVFKHSGVNLENYVGLIKKAVAHGNAGRSLRNLWLGSAVTQGDHDVVLTNVSFADDTGRGASVARVKLRNVMRNGEANTTDFDMQFEADGLVFTGGAIAPGTGIRKISFDASVKNISREAFAELTGDKLENAAVNGNGSANVSQDEATEIMDAVIKSGAALTLKELSVELNNGAFVKMAGTVTAKQDAAVKMVGKADIVIKNPDKAADEISGRVGPMLPSGKDAGAFASQMKMFAAMLSSLGNTQNDADGFPVTTVSVEITPEGKFLLNGHEAVPNFGIPAMNGAAPGGMPSAVVPAPSAPGAVVEMPAAE